MVSQKDYGITRYNPNGQTGGVGSNSEITQQDKSIIKNYTTIK